MSKSISAIDLKELYLVNQVTVAPTNYAAVTALVGTTVSGRVKIPSVHQGTFTLEESEPSQDSYRDQMTGEIYRTGKKQMGDLKVNFTIGKYDYATKVAVMGGEAITTAGTGGTSADGWKRSTTAVELTKGVIAKTYDDVYVVLCKCSIVAREANSDGAIGIAVTATMMKPDTDSLASEFWFNPES